jgi:hypothetical protein
MNTNVLARQTPAVERLEIERLLSASHFEAAHDLARRTLRAQPDDFWVWNALGMALRGSGRRAAAVAAYRRALTLQPDQAGVLSNCGNALKEMQLFDEAIDCHRQAVALAPQSAMFAANLGIALREAGLTAEALVETDRAVALAPDNANNRFDRSQLRLMLGDFAKGWQDFEARWRLREISPPRFRQPVWKGDPLPQGTVLLWPEQGFGDTILAVRFARLVKQRVGRVIVAAKPELMRLLDGVEGIDAVVPLGAALPEFDAHCPLMSLPKFFVQALGDVPPPARFAVPEASRTKLATALASAGDRLKVGIVWSGSVSFRTNHLRSTAMERFLRLAEVPGVQLFSLQKGPRAGELAEAGGDTMVTDLAPLLDDFADTAAAIAGLDLVVMTDSAVAHLAGSLGTPVWNLLPKVAYWLYLKDRPDTPWYPSMRLFRQQTHGDWDGVFTEACAALAALARRKHR